MDSLRLFHSLKPRIRWNVLLAPASQLAGEKLCHSIECFQRINYPPSHPASRNVSHNLIVFSWIAQWEEAAAAPCEIWFSFLRWSCSGGSDVPLHSFPSFVFLVPAPSPPSTGHCRTPGVGPPALSRWGSGLDPGRLHPPSPLLLPDLSHVQVQPLEALQCLNVLRVEGDIHDHQPATGYIFKTRERSGATDAGRDGRRWWDKHWTWGGKRSTRL